MTKTKQLSLVAYYGDSRIVNQSMQLDSLDLGTLQEYLDIFNLGVISKVDIELSDEETLTLTRKELKKLIQEEVSKVCSWENIPDGKVGTYKLLTTHDKD